ncbi:MAG: hypothetical protein JNL21_36030 [Myxococcales bacterium]|nr:hypothetical protein [Myxococcales bacterium]
MRFVSACRRTLLACSLVVAPMLTVVSSSHAQGVSIESATDAQKKEAQSHYERGAKAFDQKKYEDAFNSFAASYGVVRSPNAHMMMARALMGLGRHARAYNELVVVEEEGAGNPKYAPTVERSKELRAEAGQKVAVVTIKLVGEKAGPVRVLIGDQLAPIDRAFAVEPGALSIKAFVSDQQTDSKQLDVPAGQAQVVELKVGETRPPPVVAPPPKPGEPAPVAPPPVVPPPPEEEQAPRSPAATGLLIGGTAVTLLGLGGMAVGAGFYFASKEDHDFLSDPEQSGCRTEGDRTVCPESLAERIDAGRENQRNAQIAVAVGGGLTAIGVGMLIGGGVLTRGTSESASVRVLPGIGSLMIDGVF